MFDTTSRYYNLPTKTLTSNEGQVISYVSRRFLPQVKDLQIISQVTVQQGDRLDLIATRTLGNALFYWQLCDANNAMDPAALVQQPGQMLQLASPQRTQG